MELFLPQLIDSLYLDVIGFQEVRLEVGTKGGQETGESKSKVSTVSQNTFLAKKLQGYQFVFQPAMLYMEQPLERKEEGLAVFSRYPIVSSDYRLLSRLFFSPCMNILALQAILVLLLQEPLRF